ncbi:MAG: TRAP transporter small permease [Desulfitobacteriaceae bacterium]|nr:TRAP transporter small permease [Desulfitobacteriaceae bacterium]MDD4753176.1 TRAP transporter small permease [Desulfitobacteriaceae bacterium]
MKTMDKIDRIFSAIGMICLFAIMVVVSVDGLGRSLFDSPITGAYVLVEKYLMVAMIFPVIGFTWAKKGHIGVNIFYDKMPKWVQNIAYLITILFGLSLFALIGFTGYETTIKALVGNQVTSGLIRWPLWLAYIWMPIGCAVFCARLIIEFVECIIQINKCGLNKIQVSTGASSRESAD